MNRDERFRFVVHLAYNSVFGFDLLDFDPFNSTLEEFFEVVWCCDKETAILLTVENWYRKWLKLEGEPLHYFPSIYQRAQTGI